MVEQTVTPKQIKTFFGYEKLTDFSKDWKEMPDAGKQEIRDGIAAGIAAGEIDADGNLLNKDGSKFEYRSTIPVLV